jgi:hypothetical protein
MVTHPRCAAGILLGFALFASACGSSSGGSSTKGSTAATQDSSAYRAAINSVFGAVVAARGSFESGQGEAQLRSAAQEIEQADEQGMSQLHALKAPSSATALNAQLAAALAGQARDLRKVIAAAELDTSRLGDVVRESNAMEQIVNQINALP